MNQLIMKNKHLFFSLLIVLLTFSCSSDDDGGITEPETPTLKLTKAIDGLQVIEISYSEQEKPDTITFLNSNNFINLIQDNDGKLIQHQNRTYSYDASGKLETITDTNDGTCNFTYNSEGLLVRQNIVTNEQVNPPTNDILTIQRIYTYDSHNRMVSCTETDNESGNRDIAKWNFTYNTNGELIKSVATYSLDDGLTFIAGRTIELTYDSKKNPARLFSDNLLNDKSFISTFIFGINTQFNQIRPRGYVFFSLYHVPTHNVVNSTTTFNNGNSIDNVVFTYQYDGDYPITGEKVVTSIRPSGQSGFTAPLAWEYTTD